MNICEFVTRCRIIKIVFKGRNKYAAKRIFWKYFWEEAHFKGEI